MLALLEEVSEIVTDLAADQSDLTIVPTSVWFPPNDPHPPLPHRITYGQLAIGVVRNIDSGLTDRPPEVSLRIDLGEEQAQRPIATDFEVETSRSLRRESSHHGYPRHPAPQSGGGYGGQIPPLPGVPQWPRHIAGSPA